MYRRLTARASLDLEPQPTWLLYRFEEHPDQTLTALASRLDTDREDLEPLIDVLVQRGLVTTPGEPGRSGEPVTVLTPAGQSAVDRLTAARREGLTELLAGWAPQDRPELAKRPQELAHDLLADDEVMMREAAPRATRS